MDVHDVSKRKQVLENQILASVEEFERDTDTIVVMLEILRFERESNADHININSRVEVK